MTDTTAVTWMGPWYVREPNAFVPERRWARMRRTRLSEQTSLVELVLGPIVERAGDRRV